MAKIPYFFAKQILRNFPKKAKMFASHFDGNPMVGHPVYYYTVIIKIREYVVPWSLFNWCNEACWSKRVSLISLDFTYKQWEPEKSGIGRRLLDSSRVFK